MSRSLYQQYRPQNFKDIIGQPQVVSVLENAVKKDSVGHAYLFAGARGIGKTSIARIFARALKTEDIDIFEIDAASHTSVENVRELITSMHTQPSQSSYKVYILDEVHMLSKSAFNALLKTLEEPPSYAIFILVTTELEKIPETIVSRCISLTFHQPSSAILKKTVLNVAKKEGFELTEQSAALIALISEGSFRDSLTALQQVLLIADSKKITHEQVEQTLGAPSHTLVNDYVSAVIERDVASGVRALEQATEKNISMVLFAKLCLKKIRAALLLQNGAQEAAEEYNDEDKKFITEISKREELHIGTLMSVADAITRIKTMYIKSLPLEYLLIQDSTTSETTTSS